MFSNIFINFLCIVLSVNLLGILTLSFLRIYFIQKSYSSNYTLLQTAEPFVSIHFAICNEPPAIVLETLESFGELNYSNFEVVVISNNSKNASSWKPIEAYCHKKPNFKFFHFDAVKGYKAGALNIALAKTADNAEYIFTVDSDYKLHPDALKIAVGSIIDRNVDVLQFPQNYRNTCLNTEGLLINYKHYFECYLTAMDNESFGLPTGTLTLLKSDIFKAGLTWPTETITEDAHFGVELLSKKYKIGYCNYNIGMGTMPTTISDYNTQLKRWIFGNFQTLILSFKRHDLNLSKILRLCTMLTAWTNLLAIPIIASFVSLPFLFENPITTETVYILIFTSLSIHVLTQLYIMMVTSRENLTKIFKALLIHIGTLEIGSFHWISYFKNPERPFVRTNKYLISNGVSLHFFLMPITLFIAAIVCIQLESKWIGIALFMVAIIGIIGKLQLMHELSHSKYNLAKILKV